MEPIADWQWPWLLVVGREEPADGEGAAGRRREDAKEFTGLHAGQQGMIKRVGEQIVTCIAADGVIVHELSFEA